MAAKKGETVKKILVAIDGKDESRKAVDYVSSLGSLLKSYKITLLQVLPTIPPEMLEDGGSEDPDVERQLKSARDKEIGKWEGGLKNKSTRVFEESKKKLIASGIPAGHIDTKMVLRSLDIGKDIVDTAHDGGYSTVVVGRRGLSFIKELALGSVSYRVVKLAKNCTVWVVH